MSICQKHSQKILTHQTENSQLRYCSNCLIDMLTTLNSTQMHEFIFDLTKNEYKYINLEKEKIKDIAKERLSDNVMLIGFTNNKYRDYYYVFDDGTKQYAGKIDQNKKVNVWNNFVSYSYQMDEYNNNPPWIAHLKTKTKRIKTEIYSEGNQISYKEITEDTQISMELDQEESEYYPCVRFYSGEAEIVDTF